MYIPWNRPNFAPFWTLQPTLEHFTLLFRETLFLRWLANTLIISVLSTGIALGFATIVGGGALLANASGNSKKWPALGGIMIFPETCNRIGSILRQSL